MPFTHIKQVGQYGVNRDLSSSELSPNSWTDCQNIRFLDGSAYQFYGHGEVFPGTVVEPYHVLPVSVLGVRNWLYAGANKIYQVNATGGVVTHTNITRQTALVDVNYAATKNSWTSTVLGGIPVLNNGVDVPQMWSLSGKCTALTNFPASTTCAVIRAYKNSLIALNVTKTGTNYPFMVKWSHPADPGTVPVSWDIADATKDAGEVDLAEGYDSIVDGLALRDSFVIYKQQSVWRMDYTGGPYIYKFSKVLGTSGAMNRNCITELDGQHFVLTADDVVIHDGNQAVSVLDKQTRRFLFANIDSQLVNLCFVFKNPYMNEVFVCYPSAGATSCNQAMVWNWVDKTISFREIPSLNHAQVGALDNGLSQTFDGDESPFDSDITAFNAGDFTPDIARVVMASGGTKLYQLDSSTTFNGTLPTAYLERKGLHFDAPESIKLIKSIRPRIAGTNGATVNIQVGWSNEPYEAPTYGSVIPFTIGTSVSCDTMTSGRYMAIKFSSGTAYQWRLDSYSIDAQISGAW
jgi:hypothetical protein